MTQAMTPDEIDQLARRRAGAKLAWYMHLGVYLLVNAFLFLISSQGFGSRSWSLGPVLGWGLGVALHGISVFVLGQGSALRENMVRKERERLQREQNPGA